MPEPSEFSPLTVNRLSVYLRCLERLRAQGVERISSQELGRRFGLSPALFRKDLAQFGVSGIRGVGYEVDCLADGLARRLGLDRPSRMVILGAGNLGRALARYFADDSTFHAVALVDVDPKKVGNRIGGTVVEPLERLGEIVERRRVEIGVLTVPAAAAQESYDRLIEAGVGAVLNFAPRQLRSRPDVPTKNVDLRVFFEELGFYLRGG